MIMAIQFKEIRQCLARNTRLSICFEDGCYHDYLMISDIPTEKYKDLYVYGIGLVVQVIWMEKRYSGWVWW